VSGAFDASPQPVGFATFQSTLFWTSADGTVLQMSAMLPGNPALVVGASAPGVTTIGAARKFIYLGQKSQGLLVFDLDNAKQATLARKVTMDDPQAILVHGPYVYVIDFSFAQGRARLLRAELDGTGLIVLADGLTRSRGLGVAEPFVYFGDGPRIVRTTK
jgi:hypothetical protein